MDFRAQARSKQEAELLVIGIDCATLDAKTGLVLAERVESDLRILEASLCSRQRSAADTVAAWLIANPTERFLLAFDAPLGWPAALRSLSAHSAGEFLPETPDRMFRRDTDRFIQSTLGQRPLEVGADRIARTAHAALTLLDGIRGRLGARIPLAWSPDYPDRGAAIEVYPAATLRARGARSRGYKKRGQRAQRLDILSAIRNEVAMTDDALPLAEPDVLDALICALAGHDFLTSAAVPPMDEARSRLEGWIWAPRPRARGA